MERRSSGPAPKNEGFFRTLEAELLAGLPSVLALNGMGAFLWDLETDLVFLDPGALAVFGLERDGFDGRMSTLQARVVSAGPFDIRDRATAAFADADHRGSYFRIRRPGSPPRWAHVRATLKRDGTGRAVRAFGIIRDAEDEFQDATPRAVLQSDRERRSDVVRRTTAALSDALTVDDVLAVLTSDEILGAVGAVGVALSILDQDRLRTLATTGLPADLLRDMGVIRVEDTLPVPEAVRHQKPLFIGREDVRRDYPTMWPYIVGTELTAAAVLPLAAQALPTGALVILYRDKRRFFPEERNLLVALAATVAQSLQRALLYDEEHAMALGLQQSMLPATIPEAAGLRIAVRYRPARTGRQIGGDWYDAVPLAAGRIGLVVGDVQGHDIQAAAVMGQLRTALRAYATEGHTPEAIMARASVFLHDLDTDRLATCVYVDLDPATGQAVIVRAGHPCPLVRHADGRVSRPRSAGGLPLGLSDFGDLPYPVTRLRLSPGEILVLCSDGLLEFRGMDLTAGEQQLEALLSGGSPGDLDRMAQHIVDTVESREGQEDDVALLLAFLTRD